MLGSYTGAVEGGEDGTHLLNMSVRANLLAGAHMSLDGRMLEEVGRMHSVLEHHAVRQVSTLVVPR